MGSTIPEVALNSGSCKPMPLIAMGTALYPFNPSDAMRAAILRAIELGYRHFDTAAVYQSETSLGDAITDAISSGILGSRDEIFITSKLWCSAAHKDLVLPALRSTLLKLRVEYLDLYLIHWPVSLKPESGLELPFSKDKLSLLDMSSVWEAMEECQSLGLTKAIGVSNFSCRRLETLLSFCKIPPAVNEVEVNPLWQQKKLREFCMARGIRLSAYSPLGGIRTPWGKDWVMECDVLKEIAEAKGKSLAQVCLRWVYEQGDCVIVKSFNEERLKENLLIFDWELNEEERQKIAQLPQGKSCRSMDFVSADGPFKSLEELWDGEI
ncbi:deoxymugineic acid synthase 1-D-like [Typha latifolia]|uniref:deoxymugineic acid synthase 1-D-like n=1 Tax=Typha latifolia TaxID=4733 RepID=UPI003C2CDAD8